MESCKKILLVGAGNMGGAMGKAMIEKNFVQAENFFVAEKSPEKTAWFAQKNCWTGENALEVLSEMDIIILAVKPQSMAATLSEMAPHFKKEVFLISIAAGFSVENIQKISKKKCIARVMPNTPLLVGKGVSGYFCTSETKDESKIFLKKMLSCFGVAIACEAEEKINAITALSGSGPAYFFRILEIYAENAVRFGFSEEEAKKIALSTLLGAGILAENSKESFAVLRENVTSKGGTTAAALESFEKNGFAEIWQKAFDAAFERAEELSR